ncbi:MAG TPA: hypothetical protein VHY08_12245 [Bacillota bacterium]|nr:hypothetical protein [Bacillota bacterium]
MPLFRNEILKTTARLRLIRDELLERGFSKTVDTVNEAIKSLETVDTTYINELAEKKQQKPEK